jgi:hypothetical protein
MYSRLDTWFRPSERQDLGGGIVGKRGCTFHWANRKVREAYRPQHSYNTTQWIPSSESIKLTLASNGVTASFTTGRQNAETSRLESSATSSILHKAHQASSLVSSKEAPGYCAFPKPRAHHSDAHNPHHQRCSPPFDARRYYSCSFYQRNIASGRQHTLVGPQDLRMGRSLLTA